MDFDFGRDFMKIGLNGFGRIGRHIVRASIERGLFGKEFDLVGINYSHKTEQGLYLLKYDSSHGILDAELGEEDGDFVINGKRIKKFSTRNPLEIDWKSLDVDVVLECTGVFRKKEQAMMHIKAGAKKVLISAPSPDADITLVYGVNHNEYDSQKHQIISNASCTTNCLAPIVKVLEDNFGIEQGMMTTTHAYTNDQMILDGNHRKDWRRGRSAGVSIIPTSTGAASAIGKVIPKLNGKLEGTSLRVPVQDGSIIDLTCTLKEETSVEKINLAMKQASQTYLKGIMEYAKDPLVSSDIIGNYHSAIFDPFLTKANGKNIQVFAWYDNEWGYSNRMLDVLLKVIGK